MEGIDRETRPAGREVSVLAFGDTADEVERRRWTRPARSSASRSGWR